MNLAPELSSRKFRVAAFWAPLITLMVSWLNQRFALGISDGTIYAILGLFGVQIAGTAAEDMAEKNQQHQLTRLLKEHKAEAEADAEPKQ